MPRALAILILLWAGAAGAGGWPKLPRGGEHAPAPTGLTAAEDVQQDDSGISPGEAARRAQQMNNGGRVLSVEPANGGWRVKLIKHGDVRIVFVPD